MLTTIKKYFGIGNIIFQKNNTIIRYVINELPNCIIIKDHFLKYSLLSFKLVYFNLWCLLIDILLNKEHLNKEGLLKIRTLKVHSSKGLLELLKQEFFDFVPFPLLVYSSDYSLINIFWLAGFINADGSFCLYTQPNKITGCICKFRIRIIQHTNSIDLMEAICIFLGKVYIKRSKPISKLKIFNIKEVNIFIIKFNNAKLLSAKALDYADFCKTITFINNNSHLTKEGQVTYKKIAT